MSEELQERRGPTYGTLIYDPAFVLAVIYTVGFFTVLFILLEQNIPEKNAEIVEKILPILSAIQLGIVQYFYNKSSQQQQERSNAVVVKALDNAAKTSEATTTLAASAVKPVDSGTQGTSPALDTNRP